jgi:hypothetical protein
VKPGQHGLILQYGLTIRMQTQITTDMQAPFDGCNDNT